MVTAALSSTLVLFLLTGSFTNANPLAGDKLRERAGEPTSDFFPPTATASDPGNGPFPSETRVGYPGPTPTGTEPFLVQIAPSAPKVDTYFPLVRPPTADADATSDYDIVKKGFGNLSPFQSLPSDAFGLSEASEILPSECTLEQVHITHRHGARYPTSGAAPASFASLLADATANGTFHATGALSWLNDWSYRLGSEILTPFGRKQLFELGLGFRQKYGYLLNDFSSTKRLPVFRTTSEDRMYKSAVNFAAGFFGVPDFLTDYHQSIIIEASGFNNTLAPYDTCNNSNISPYGDLSSVPVTNWTNTYLKSAVKRIQPFIKGIELTANDAYAMQQVCAYEIVSLGYSRFCELFTDEEWEGFDYSIDLNFWYGSFWGNPTIAAQGVGWVQELVARLTQTPIAVHNSTTNSTLDNSDETFPLDQSIYVDATHDTVITTFLAAMNFTLFADEGPLPWTHIPSKRSYITRYVSPFAGNLHAQVLSCPSSIYSGSSKPEETKDSQKFIRWILNDAVLPATGLKGYCGENKHGLCPLDDFVAGLRKRIEVIDFEYDCFANYSVSYDIVDARPPGQQA